MPRSRGDGTTFRLVGRRRRTPLLAIARGEAAAFIAAFEIGQRFQRDTEGLV